MDESSEPETIEIDIEVVQSESMASLLDVSKASQDQELLDDVWQASSTCSQASSESDKCQQSETGEQEKVEGNGLTSEKQPDLAESADEAGRVVESVERAEYDQEATDQPTAQTEQLRLEVSNNLVSLAEQVENDLRISAQTGILPDESDTNQQPDPEPEPEHEPEHEPEPEPEPEPGAEAEAPTCAQVSLRETLENLAEHCQPAEDLMGDLEAPESSTQSETCERPGEEVELVGQELQADEKRELSEQASQVEADEEIVCELYVEDQHVPFDLEVATSATACAQMAALTSGLLIGPEVQAQRTSLLESEAESSGEAKVTLRLDVAASSKSEGDSPGTPKSETTTEGGQGADDLERELECEPSFERRDVELKRNRDPRQDFELGDELGRGKFGTVYRCTERTSGRQLAAKFVHMRRREDRVDVEREISIMSVLQHKRLLQLYDAYDDGKSEMCLITELIEGGELFERIVDDDFQLTERKAAIFMRQICEGVEYMHEQKIVHLDMKPENILCVSKTGNRIKLIDFGLARKLDGQEPLRVMFGTPDFAAPEVLAYDIVSLATDMWSVGVICYVLLSGMSPFMGDNDMETMANVTRATYDFDDEAFDPISDLAKDFIAKLLVRNQADRLTPTQCLKHPWLTKRVGASRRGSLASAANPAKSGELALETLSEESNELELASQDIELDFEDEPSLSKRRLKKYVIRRKWHKTVHAIMALGRMGANLKLKL